MGWMASLLALLVLVVYAYAVDIPNWSGSYTCHPSSYVQPKTYEEVMPYRVLNLNADWIKLLFMKSTIKFIPDYLPLCDLGCGVSAHPSESPSFGSSSFL